MADINNLVSVSITLNTRAFTASSFSTMMLPYTATSGDTTPHLVVSQADALANTSMLSTDWCYGALGVAFGQSPGPKKILVIPVQAGAVLTDALTASLTAASALGGYYGGVAQAATPTLATALAAWGTANKRIMLMSDAETDAGDPTKTDDILSILKAGNYEYAAGIGRPPGATENYAATALMASRFAYQPGSENWSNAPLVGVTSDNLSATQRSTILGKNGTTFEPYGSGNGGNSIAMSFGGTTGSGERIDVVRFRDFLVNDIQIRVATNLAKQPKVPYTNAGISTVKSGIIAALENGVSIGGIAPPEVDASGTLQPSYTVTAPLRYQVSAADLSARVLNNVSFTARLAGAINSAGIAGTLTY